MDAISFVCCTVCFNEKDSDLFSLDFRRRFPLSAIMASVPVGGTVSGERDSKMDLDSP